MPPAFDSICFSDGYTAAARWWRPERPRAAVLFLHGIQSHGGWYEGSGEALAAAGLAVLMPDRRGSGLNREQRGHADSAERLMQDGVELLDALRSRIGMEAAHLIGVSWGGKFSVCLADAAGARVASLALVAPGLYPKLDLPMAEKLRVAYAMMSDRRRAFALPLNEPELFTKNPQRLAFLRADGLKLVEASASFLLASRRLDRRAARFVRSTWRGPLAVWLAGQDRIIDNARTRVFVEQVAAGPKRIFEHPQAMHTLEFEADGEFQPELVEWVTACATGRHAAADATRTTPASTSV